ncbi:MAG: hypothetical protein EAZ60_08165 [Oscillatoriales cyanobacterium]|nr:MAG: hypothetical protein EAZ83_22050 [Oscillatoriales cyanobacterium]TAE98860.1 MAG: hypothetical protein EAZ79_06580 [Oscillatoriales cyanobacterium]TAF16727.1 MAG: hypothetical protein EAZ73_23580 [Oscillatoriales cyanobacterium]TAF27077.1 MAG: hypothetical protein EAZ69_28410 [Oscillatoriales cyanobacterium]TAF57065.1 MAG: hypothetical protein EAZ60_08165 [Oscillatoriales cyanobacterium]
MAIVTLALDKMTDLFSGLYSRARIASSVMNLFLIDFPCQHLQDLHRNQFFPVKKSSLRGMQYLAPD